MSYKLKAIMLASLALMLGCGYHKSSVPVLPSAVLPECTVQGRQAKEDIVVRVTIANHAPQPFHLLSWNLPRSGQMTTALFQVYRDGTPVEYRGIMMKRGEVSHSDYISIPSGKAFSVDVPLQQGYDVRPTGKYTITYNAFNPRFNSTGLDNLTSELTTLVKH